jgi:hypothetical protein
VGPDTATGKQLWIHEGVDGVNSRGINYWEARRGKTAGYGLVDYAPAR